VSEYLAAARAAARAARELLRTARPEQVRHKRNPRDLVTEWDVRSEETIRAVLEEHAPGIPVLGEEGGGDHGARGRMQWVVDPIDGTVNFAHGFPLWSVSIALEEAGRTIAGVVVAPALDWWFEASLGGGAFDGTGAPLRVSATRELQHALLVTGFPYDRATNPENNFAAWEHLKRVAAVRRLGAASLDLCLVAKGALDGYWERRLHAWDLAAGALIVAEAGGTVTDTRGGPFDAHSGEAVATNGAIHEGLVHELDKVRR
jgi:myo-inositol-1(or 4)-monophosphatase